MYYSGIDNIGIKTTSVFLTVKISVFLTVILLLLHFVALDRVLLTIYASQLTDILHLLH